MRLFMSISVAVSFAAASLTVRGEQAPDKFIVGWPLPFDTISLHRPLDTTCENEGRPKPKDGVLDGNKEQNRAKNNFCAAGSLTVTQKTFKDLEGTFGKHELVPRSMKAPWCEPWHS